MGHAPGSDPLAVGSVLHGRYRLEREIGHGGMGALFRATHLGLGEPRAVRVIASPYGRDPEYIARFRRDASAASRLEHAHVITVDDFGEFEGRLYLVMQYVEGIDFRRIIDHDGPLDPARALKLLGDIGGALDSAHVAGVVHGNVKPSSILVVHRRADEEALLSDFGLATPPAPNPRATKPSMQNETADYMPPEQFERQAVDGRSDVYSLGCVLYHALSANSPGANQLYADPPPLSKVRPQLPAGFDAVVARARERDPDRRYATAGELMKAAAATAAEESGSAATRLRAYGDLRPHRVVPSPSSAARESRSWRSGWLPILAAVLFLGIAIGAAALVASRGAQSDRGDKRTPSSTATAETTASASSTPTAETTAAPSSTPTADTTAAPSSTPTADTTATPSLQEPSVAGPVPRTDFADYLPKSRGYRTVLPTGAEWTTAREKLHKKAIHRTVAHRADGMTVMIDYTPQDAAAFKDPQRCERASHSAFPLAEVCTFQGGSLPQCRANRCVDYLLNSSDQGPGYAVLVGGGSLRETRRIAAEVAGHLTAR